MDAVQHFEIPYKVRERAKKFYFDAFHWQLFDVPGTGYTFATTVEVESNGMPKRPGAINGGLAPRSKENTAPVVLMRVTDLKAHLERIRHAGGTILQEPVAMGPVWVARFRDPEGNVMGVIQPRPEGMESAVAADAKGKDKQAAQKAKPKAAKKSKAKPKRAKSSKSATRTAAKTSKASSKSAKALSKGTKTGGKGTKASRTGTKAPGKGAKASDKGAKATITKPKTRKAKAPQEAKPVWSR